MSYTSNSGTRLNSLLAKIILDVMIPFQYNLEQLLEIFDNNQTGTLNSLSLVAIQNFQEKEAEVLNKLLVDPNVTTTPAVGATSLIFNIYSKYRCFDATLGNMDTYNTIPYNYVSSGPYSIFYIGDIFAIDGEVTRTISANSQYPDATTTITDVYTQLCEMNVCANKVVNDYKLILNDEQPKW